MKTAALTLTILFAACGGGTAEHDDAGPGDAMTNQNDGNAIIDAILGSDGRMEMDGSMPADTSSAIADALKAAMPPSTTIVHADIVARIKNVPQRVAFVNDDSNTKVSPEFRTMERLDSPVGKIAFTPYHPHLPLGVLCKCPRSISGRESYILTPPGHTFAIFSQTTIRAARFATTAEVMAVRTKEIGVISIDELIDAVLKLPQDGPNNIETMIEQWNTAVSNFTCPAP